MNKNMDRLYEFRDKFESWDDGRIRKIFDRLVNGEVCTFSTTSLESSDQNATEIQRAVTELRKSNHFGEDQTVRTITQYVFYFWDNVKSLFTIDGNKDEFEQFKTWFIDLTETDCDSDGMTWIDCDCFITEWKEFTNEYSHTEMWELLEAEDLV